MATIQELLADDPLCDAACSRLIGHGREDDFVDFKQSFDPAVDRSWILLAVDCVALANTRGGYVVIGVEDKSWRPIGVSTDVADALRDPKRVLEKLNRNLMPALTRVTTRIYSENGLDYAVIAIPPSEDCTHIFESNLDWSPASPKSIVLVPKGAIYVRRAGSNQILTATDFEELVNRRLTRFRNKILEGVGRVMQAPPDEEVVTIKKIQDATGAVELKIGSAPESLDLKGRPLTFAAHSIVERIKIYRELVPGNPADGYGRTLCLMAYVNRESLEGEEDVVHWLAVQSIVDGLPAFRWLRPLDLSDARKAIRTAYAVATYRKEGVVRLSMFYGESFNRELYERFASTGRPGGPRVRDRQNVFNTGVSSNPATDRRAATALAERLLTERDARAERELLRLDCALYAPF